MGVFVMPVLTIQTSRVDESKVIIVGGPNVRFQNVYTLRRYSPSPSAST